MPTQGNKKRRICPVCFKSRYIENMECVGIKNGSHFQVGKKIEVFVCLGCDIENIRSTNMKLYNKIE